MSLLLLFNGGASQPADLRDWSWTAGPPLYSGTTAGTVSTSNMTAGAPLHRTSED